MKQIYLITILLSLTACFENKNKYTKNECFPDKGIKIAKTTIESNSKYGYREVKYDKHGLPLVIINTFDGSEHIKEYNNGMLKLIINKKKEMPNFWLENQFDSILANAKIVIDTSFILNYNKDGRPKEIKEAGGTILIYDYNSCDSELVTTLNSKGDTIQQFHSTNKNSVLIESILTVFNPKYSLITKYFGYEFNNKGQWIKRKYKHQGEDIITEIRELTYY